MTWKGENHRKEIVAMMNLRNDDIVHKKAAASYLRGSRFLCQTIFFTLSKNAATMFLSAKSQVQTTNNISIAQHRG